MHAAREAIEPKELSYVIPATVIELMAIWGMGYATFPVRMFITSIQTNM